jgi:two-component system NarL family sensor kinase
MQTLNHEVLRSQIEIRDHSFRYLTAEIHDNLGQSLSAVGLHLYQLESESSQQRRQVLIRQSSELLNKAINDLRSITHLLDTSHLANASLLEALSQEILTVETFTEARCELQILGEAVALSEDHQILIFRLMQQAIDFAVRIAEASELMLMLSYEGERLQVSIRDNGNTHDPNLGTTSSGSYLSGMQLRAKLLGGTVSLEPHPEGGNIFTLSISNPTL